MAILQDRDQGGEELSGCLQPTAAMTPEEPLDAELTDMSWSRFREGLSTASRDGFDPRAEGPLTARAKTV